MKKKNYLYTLPLAVFLLLFPFVITARSLEAKLRPAYLRVVMPDAKPSDTLRVLIYSNVLSNITDANKQHEEQFATLKNGEFDFLIDPFNKPAYFSLCKKEGIGAGTRYLDMLTLYLIEPGDSVTVHILKDTTYIPSDHMVNSNTLGRLPEMEVFGTKYIKQYTHIFEGRGSAKFAFREELDRIVQNERLTTDQKKVLGLDLISSLKIMLTFNASELLKADLIGQIEILKLRTGIIEKDFQETAIPASRDSIRPEIIAISKYYPLFLIERYMSLNVLNKEDKSEIYSQILTDYTDGNARDKLITLYLLRNASSVSPEIMEDAIMRVQTPYLAREVQELYGALSKGSVAYNFSLQDMEGKTVKLSDFKGKVVMMDFWFSGCGACKKYFTNMLSSVEEHFKDRRDVVFISVSIDRSKAVWLKSLDSKMYTSDHAINLYTGGRGTKDPVIAHYKVSSCPWTLLIDKNGKIFSNRYSDLRTGGIERLKNVIESAVAM
ncbi:hypothetical protein ADIARSV_0512 [Arcticibacter svalbardensis MN12-7]|uniref:Thioredoxin domain-containing protein n=1 Tax=Arcticibacter svalbardensis MN12-7 TaxID=1150600 RepID=R9GWU2_9SPHI|nr:TlpA disulfide reductase family protein [Arcticibacter svalbardensis]EOR96277.1 hypothetical protein ADIARSV_0512 [Arcticibacter svalbardensis MN12-7]